MRLKNRLRLMIGATFFAIATVATAVVVPYQSRETKRDIERGGSHLRYVAEQLAPPLVDLSYSKLLANATEAELAPVLRASRDIAFAAVYDPGGALVAHAEQGGVDEPPATIDPAAAALLGKDPRPIRREHVGDDGWVIEYYFPLQHAGRGHGTLYLSYSLAATERQQNLVFYGMAGLLAALFAVLFTLTGAFLRRVVVQRLGRLALLMQRAVEVELDVTYDEGGADEITSIGKSFNTMVRGLKEREFIKSTFGSYVSPEVVKRVLEGGESVVHGQRRRVTVLFADIRSFTTISEQLQPEDVVALLNDYLERMTAVIAKRGGRIDKFIGDAVMADWGALEEAPGGPALAAIAAVDAVNELVRLNAQRAARGAFPLKIGIGLHVGEVVAGSVGSSRKLEFTIIGDTVNIASRLEGLCKTYGARVIASEEVASAARATLRVRELDQVILKGKHTATRIFEVLSEADPCAAHVTDYEAAMAAFRARDFAKAVTLFEKASGGEDDAVAQFQLERARRYAAHPPEGDLVVKMESK